MPGCMPDECAENRVTTPLAGFYYIDASKGNKSEKLELDSIEVYGINQPGDSILFNGKNRISQLYIPFRIDNDTTKYVIRYLYKDLAALNLRDTLTFIYTRQPRLVSETCGVSYLFDIQKVANTNMLIDSVVYTKVVSSKPIENFKIYFR